MQARRVQTGNSIDYTPSTAITSGDVIVQGDLVGVADTDIASSALGSISVEGVFAFTKAAGSITFAIDDPVYWDDTNNTAVATPGAGPYLGLCVKAAAAADTEVHVKLDPHGRAERSLLFSAAAASAAVTNTAVETAFDKAVTIPANTLRPGDVIRVRAQGTVTAANLADTLDIQLRLGATDVLATGAVDSAVGDIFFIDADITIRTIGAGGTMVAAGHTANGVPGTVTAKPRFLGSTAIDTTVEQSVNVSATWSLANAGNSCRLDVMNVQLLRK